MRSIILRNIIFFLFALIAFDLFYLQVIRGGYFFRLSQSNSLRIISVDGPRGRILDRNGRILAESIKGYAAVVIPQDMKRKTALFSFLAGVLKVDAVILERKFNRDRGNPFAPVVVADGLSREQAIALAEEAYLYPGLRVTERYRRQYPNAEIGAHVLGYVGKIDPDKMQQLVNDGISVPEFIGYTGVEGAMEEQLRGTAGGREVEVNSRGREVRVLSIREPSAGKDVTLTIDQRIQAAAYDELAGRRGAFVMMEPLTGELVSLVSSPAYDPNVFSGPERRWRSSEYLNDALSPMVNRAFQAAFTPGSVFKIPVSFAALEENKIQLTTTFNCPGYFELGGRRFTFAHAYGPQNLIEAMAHSANEYFFYTGLMVGPEKIVDYARRFGLGERTGLDLPYEAKGNIPSGPFRRGWFKGDTANLSIGQGALLDTPLQLARMMAAVENGGYVLRPRIIKSVGGEDVCREEKVEGGRWKTEGGKFPTFDFRPSTFRDCRSVARKLAFRPDVWEAMRQSLRAVVAMPTGTAKALDIEGLDIYGKTGTAQTSPGKPDHAWFVGLVRGGKRTLSFCVFLEHGGSSQNAVQAAQQILLRLKADGLI